MKTLSEKLNALSDYEKCIIFSAMHFATTLVVAANGNRIPAPVHRKAWAKLERLGVFAKTSRISVTPEVVAWVNDNHMSIPSHLYPTM